MQHLVLNTMNRERSQKKGRDNHMQNRRLPGIMDDIFAELLPSVKVPPKKEPQDAYGRGFSVNQKKGARRR